MDETQKDNITLTKIELNQPIALSFDDGCLEITTDRKIILSHCHSQDCCEHVYADWSGIEPYSKEIVGRKFDILTIKAVPKLGILLCFDDLVKVFIPCHNEQNGYYSSSLKLNILDNGVSHDIDISEFVEDNIN